ncbi:PEP-CTERM sorting domain-containing protein [Planctomycetota bacterium]|nr:PEP-CTERM sorting domain-containing protein [Planctomycetota bacterium]
MFKLLGIFTALVITVSVQAETIELFIESTGVTFEETVELYNGAEWVFVENDGDETYFEAELDIELPSTDIWFRFGDDQFAHYYQSSVDGGDVALMYQNDDQGLAFDWASGVVDQGEGGKLAIVPLLITGEKWYPVTPSIPEPASLMLVSMGSLLLLRRRN